MKQRKTDTHYPSAFKEDQLKGAGWESVLRIQPHPRLLQAPLFPVHAKQVGASECRKPFLQNKNTLKYLQNMLGVKVVLLRS